MDSLALFFQELSRDLAGAEADNPRGTVDGDGCAGDGLDVVALFEAIKNAFVVEFYGKWDSLQKNL